MKLLSGASSQFPRGTSDTTDACSSSSSLSCDLILENILPALFLALPRFIASLAAAQMPPRIPTEDDFAPLSPSLSLSLQYPSPRESTTAFLILLHGLGDSENPFASFARNLSLPGVLAIAVRGVSALPAFLLPGDEDTRGFHWGDDLRLDNESSDLDPDPGFKSATTAILDRLIAGVLVHRCGWLPSDVLLFGFGQGGSLALGLASRLRSGTCLSDADADAGSGSDFATFKGVVSIGGPLPLSMVPTTSARQRSETSVLLCQLDDDLVDAVKEEFSHVKAVRWKRNDVAMPRNRDEALPIIQFFADRLKSPW